jgi:FAD/FMN-containing dehydrogenase
MTSTPPSTGSRAGRNGLSALGSRLHGSLSLPGSPGYDPSALLYNARFASQSQPAAIAHVANPRDVADCVRYAADSDTPLHIRNGGHSYGGWSSGSGLVVDLANMNAVRVDHAAGTATVGAGALLVHVYDVLGNQGVSIGAGSCATVGVSGLTLGGGVGVLSRAYGLTCDQVQSAEVVLADGTRTTVDADHHPDLFWALRGGGGSFAAVTSWTFRVRPAPQVQTFFAVWDWSAAADVLDAWQHWSTQVPRELWSTCKLLADPGKGMRAQVAGTWIGRGSPQRHVQALFRAVGHQPSEHYTSGGAYRDTMFAEAGCSGKTAGECVAFSYAPAQRQPEAAASSMLQQPLPRAGVAAIVEAVAAGMDVTGMIEGGVSFDAFGGAIADVDASDTAFPWRSALADIQYTATWPFAGATSSPTRFDRFVRRERRALQPWVGSEAYVNYADPSLRNYAKAYWGPNLRRLSRVKSTYDPHDLFRFAQSVPRR